MKSSLTNLLLALPLLAGAATVHPTHPCAGGAHTISVEPVSETILRVRATPDDTLPAKHASLCVVPQAAFADYTVRQTKTAVVVATSRVQASIDRRTGRIDFTDPKTGRTLLAERDGGKTFVRYTSPQTTLPAAYRPSAPGELPTSHITTAQRTGYSWTARFASPDDEAFYGLGQHQNETMNYKGQDEELYQYNTKVSVPMVVSTRGYGVLWDSYSLCRWGNPYPYGNLGEHLQLFDAQGQPGALTATYDDGKGNVLTRREDSLCFENSATIGLLPNIPLKHATVTYEGTLVAPADYVYRFAAYYAGYVRITIDGKEVMPTRWRTAWNPNTYKFECPLTAGRRTPIRIEWRPDGDVSYCALRVARPITRQEQQDMTIWSEMTPDMDYYFIRGADMDETVAGYRTLTGRAPVMPKWAMGFWQSRERYKTQDELVGTLAEFRRRHIPVDNIVQDWSYWPEDAWGSHEFEAARYPDPRAALDSVHAMHGRFMISVWPKFYKDTRHYRQFAARGWMYEQAVSDSLRDWIGPGYIGSFYDAYSAGARRMFWQQMDSTLYTGLGRGIDAWWMDASEPNVKDCTPLPYRKALCGPTALGTSDEYFNAYALMNAEAIYHGQRATEPRRRVFLLTRSGFAGLQRYSTATWSGDIATRWEDMRAQMTAGLNFSVSGIPFWGMDQGGFTPEDRYVAAAAKPGSRPDDTDEWQELNARWNQFGCFVPLYRTHGQWPTREVWNIAPEGSPCYNSIVYYHRLRYRLMPYLYSMAGWVNTRHYTILRPLAMDFTDDTAVRDVKDQWMFGPALMACPVSQYKARTRTVRLPAARGWYDYYTGQHHAGGQTITADAPVERIPLYVPDGTILPTGPDMEYTDQCPADTITLSIYAGRDATFQLYEDDGNTYDYEHGASTTIDIAWSDSSRTLRLGQRQGSYPGMLSRRTFIIRLITPQGTQTKTVAYDTSDTTVQL